MLDELLKILVGSPSSPDEAKSDNPLGDLLKVVLGGQGNGNDPDTAPSQGGLGDILQVILGNKGQAEGSSSEEGEEPDAAADNPLIATIARLLSEKLGISPEVTQVVVTFALTLVLAQLQKSEGDTTQITVPSQNAIRQSGVAKQLATQTGMNQKDAAATLQQAISLLTGQTSSKTRRVKQATGQKPSKPAKPRKPRPTTHEPVATTTAGRGRAKPKRM